VIDPEMTDQIRVTVVATGIGRPQAVKQMPPAQRPLEVVHNNRRAAAAAAAATGGGYDVYQTPAFMRRRAVGDDVAPASGGDESFLDIPAFLRRQAD